MVNERSIAFIRFNAQRVLDFRGNYGFLTLNIDKITISHF